MFWKYSMFQVQFCGTNKMLPVCITLIEIESILKCSLFRNFCYHFLWHSIVGMLIIEFVQFAILSVSNVAEY